MDQTAPGGAGSTDGGDSPGDAAGAVLPPDPRAGLPVRVVAGLTALYSVAITVAPRLLARPCGLVDRRGRVPADVAALVRSIGTRDATMALALGLAPAGQATTVLTAARVVSDAADAVWLGRVVPRGQRAKVAGVALGWAALEVAVAAAANRRPAR